MFRQTVSKAAPALKSVTAQQTRAYSKGTILGRLGSAPSVHQSSNGKEFYMYNLAVNRPPKKDAAGELVRDENGFPVRDTDWFTVFNFRENAKQSMERLAGGDLVLVDFNLTTRKQAESGETDTMIHETSHRLVSSSNRAE